MRRIRAEDYLAAIEVLAERSASSRATTDSIARQLNVSKGNVSGVMKALADQGLVDWVPYEGAMLTDVGGRRARYTVRRQRLLKLFLSQTLGIGWESVAEEAWRLEPSVSERLIERIDVYLKHPEYDPHGDPIPCPDGVLPQQIVTPLTNAPIGVAMVVARVVGLTSEALKYLTAIGLSVGGQVTVRKISNEGQVVMLETAQGPATIGVDRATGVLVKISQSAPTT